MAEERAWNQRRTKHVQGSNTHPVKTHTDSTSSCRACRVLSDYLIMSAVWIRALCVVPHPCIYTSKPSSLQLQKKYMKHRLYDKSISAEYGGNRDAPSTRFRHVPSESPWIMECGRVRRAILARLHSIQAIAAAVS